MDKGGQAARRGEGTQSSAVRSRDVHKQSITGHMYEGVAMKI